MPILASLTAAASLGAMLYFSFAIAPMVFKVLPATDAGRFLRALFPVYFLINGLVAIGAGLLAWHPVATPLFVAAGVAMLAVRYLAIPVVNTARDEMLAGLEGAKTRFDRWHRLTVVVNLAEMAALVAGIVLLLRATP